MLAFPERVLGADWRDRFPDYFGPESIQLVVEVTRAFGSYSAKGWEPLPEDPFGGLDWWDLPLEVVWHYRDDLSELPYERSLYYIPAFIVGVFAMPQRWGGWDLISSAISFLQLGKAAQFADWNQDQRNAVIRFVQFISREDEPAEFNPRPTMCSDICGQLTKAAQLES